MNVEEHSNANRSKVYLKSPERRYSNAELGKLLANVREHPSDAARLKFLRACQGQLHDFAFDVVLCSRDLLSSTQKQSKLKDELWCILEQAFVALLQTSNVSGQARTIYDNLRKKFPHSKRVKRLLGMLYESEKDIERAEIIYRAIVKESPNDTFTWKRLATLPLNTGNIDGAIEGLVDYNSRFMADQDGWIRLSELYLQKYCFRYAAFCVEECIMINPDNFFLPLQAAEILFNVYTMESLRDAIFYFAQCVQLNSMCSRGWLGLCQSCASLRSMILPPSSKMAKKRRLTDDESFEVEKCEKLFLKGRDNVLRLYNREESKWSLPFISKLFSDLARNAEINLPSPQGK